MKRELKIILFTSAMLALSVEMFGPIYAVFVERIGGDLLTAGGAYSLFGISTGILMLIIAHWEDRVNYQEKLIVLSNVLTSIGILGYIFISEPIHLFIVQIVFGVSQAVGTPVKDAIYSKAVDKKRPAFQWGMWEAMWYIVGGIGAITGGYLANLYGFRPVFVIMFMFSLISLVASLFLLKEKK